MRADRPSLTATLVAGVRALYAAFPEHLRIAHDPHAASLVPLLLALPGRAVESAPFLAGPMHHALGAVSLGLTWHVALRTLAIDDAAREAIQAGAKQIVLLGAGLDNRAGRLAEAAAGRVFEVDHPDMQRYKRARLEEAGVMGSRVLVPVNFERDRLDASLENAGFERQTPTFWIWEGVTPYLTPDAVKGTLAAVSSLSSRGSRLAITYMRHAGDVGHAIDRAAGLVARVIGEPVHARYRKDEMASLLADSGFQVMSDDSDADLADRYWKDPPAVHPRSIRFFPEWERLAVAERV